MRFETLNLDERLLNGVRDAGFERCTPVQEQALPECLAGKDVIAQSQTGSGKTAVFLLTIMNRFMELGITPGRKPRALIMTPTRELAVQVYEDARKLGRHTDFRSVAVYGGVQYEKQLPALNEGVEIVVATPGRLIDFYKSKDVSFDDIDIFVIDEADRMFDMGFAPDVRYIAGRLPRERERQTLLFSATIDHNVHRLASRYMKPELEIIEIEPEQVTVDAIDQKVIYVSNEEKLPVLMALLKRPGVERVIIFTNMKRTAEMLGFKLQGNGLPAEVLTGDVSQSKRQRIIDGMKSGKVTMLVATDVAARGLHIEDVSHVINYDLPDEPASYVHRIGRTARAGKTGVAYSLACEDYVLNLPPIEGFIERQIEKEWVEPEEQVEDRAGAYRRRRPGGPGARRTEGRRPSGPGKGPRREGGGRSGGGRTGGKGPRMAKKDRPAGEKGAAEAPQAKEAAGSAKKEAPAPVSGAPGGAPSGAEGQGGEPRKRRRRRRSRGGRPRTGAGEGPKKEEKAAARPEGETGGTKRTPEAGEKGLGSRPGGQQRRRSRGGRGGRGRKSAEAGAGEKGDRLDYYRKKYGDSFSKQKADRESGKEPGRRERKPYVQPETVGPVKMFDSKTRRAGESRGGEEEKKGGIFKKVLNIFGKKD